MRNLRVLCDYFLLGCSCSTGVDHQRAVPALGLWLEATKMLIFPFFRAVNFRTSPKINRSILGTMSVFCRSQVCRSCLQVDVQAAGLLFNIWILSPQLALLFS